MDMPSAAAVRRALKGLTRTQIARLAELSGVPATTIYKIQRGETQNPRLKTVCGFMPHVRRV